MAAPRWEWFDLIWGGSAARWEWFDLSWEVPVPPPLIAARFLGILRSSYLVVGDTDKKNKAGEWQRIPLAKQILPRNKQLVNYQYAPEIAVSDQVTDIRFPWGVTQVQLLAIKNVGADNDLTVFWTPVGQSEALMTTLSPGSVFFFLEADLTQGISSLALQAVSGSTVADILMSG